MEKKYYKTLSYLSVYLISFFSVAFSVFAGSDIQVISSTDNEFHFTVTLQPSDLNHYTNRDSAEVYLKSIKVGIPYGALIELASVKGLSFNQTDNKLFQNKKTASGMPLVSVSEPVTIRKRQMVSVDIFPVNADGYYETIEVKLTFTGGLFQDGKPVNDPRFDKIFRNALANYDRFKNWQIPVESSAKKLFAESSLFPVSSVWYKIYVDHTGLIKVTGAQLEASGLVLNDIPSDDIHLFYGGGLLLPPENDSTRPELEQLPIIVNDSGDDIFNSDDFFLFYGEDVDRWLYLPVDTFMNNPYTDQNVYWLAVSSEFGSPGLRINQRSVSPDGSYDTSITSFTRRVHTEQDNMLLMRDDGAIDDYYYWYWSNDTIMTLYVSTPGVISGSTANLILNGHTYDPTGTSDDLGYMNITVNGIDGLNKLCNTDRCLYNSTDLTTGLNEIDLHLWGSSSVAPYFDNIDIEYLSYLQPVSSRLEIVVDAYDGEAEFTVSDEFDGSPMLFDITDTKEPMQLVDFASTGTIVFETYLNPGAVNRFYMATEGAVFAPSSIEQVTPADLRLASSQTDFIVVTPEEFTSALGGYLDFREAEGYSCRIVSVEDIMENFSWGLYDPVAIRDFLKYAYENYTVPVPFAVLFVGDGTYDFMNHLGTDIPNYVPPFISLVDETYSSSDDNYVYFGRHGILDGDSSYFNPDRGYDMITARWPVTTTGEIGTVIDKIMTYENSSNFGAWRTKISLVADDENGSSTNETIHVTQTEVLEKYHVPRFFNREKIYLWDYPWVNGTRPDVNDAIVNSFNEGTLLVNYVGHGNPNVWAHEHVFARLEDIPRLTNYDRLPLVFSASCAIGFFDDPNRSGMAEELLLSPSGGAIATVSATRLVYSAPNHTFNTDVYDKMLYDKSLTMCEAMYTAKLERQYSGPSPVPMYNDRAYLFFGDPLMNLGLAEHSIEFDEAHTPASLTALAPATVSGRIVNEEGNPVGGNGVLTVDVYDSDREKIYRILNDSGEVISSVPYLMTGPTIFRGKATIVNGEFSFEFIPPLDVGYGGKGARISFYAGIDETDAVGVIDSIEIADTIAIFADSSGPLIQYNFSGRSDFVSGDYIYADNELEVTISDSSGINLAGGLGHGISLEIDYKAENTVNLTSLFDYDQDDYTTGRLVYPLEDLETGRHDFRLIAWDNANNPSVVEFTAEIVTEQKLAIIDLLNYPNPMKEYTTFSFRINQPVTSLSLEIFTLSGKRIKKFNKYSLVPSYYDDIIWYGDDADGDRVATGVYIYKASATPVAGSESVENFGKVVVVN